MNKHLSNVLSGHLQINSVLAQYRVTEVNQTACKKVRNYVLKAMLP